MAPLAFLWALNDLMVMLIHVIYINIDSPIDRQNERIKHKFLENVSKALWEKCDCK